MGAPAPVNPHRTGRLVVVLVVFGVATLAVAFFGNPVSWYARPTVPAGLSGLGEDRPVLPATFLAAEAWRSLAPLGQRPVAGRTGRGSPFVPGVDAAGTASGRDSLRVSHLADFRAALAAYRRSSGSYPVAVDRTLGGPEAQCLIAAGWGDAAACAQTTSAYLAAAPADPSPSGRYQYSSDGLTYRLTVTLESAPEGSRQLTLTPAGLAE